MSKLLGIEAFVQVAQARSFSDAARTLGISKSLVSTRIRQLEELIGVPLLQRNTRNVSVTEAGRSFYDECIHVVGRATEVIDHMREQSSTPYGVLRVHALPGFVLGFFGEVIGRFQERYPEITLDLVISDAIVDPVREGYDCVLQLFEPVSETLVARKLLNWRGVFCASPRYLDVHDDPQRPNDLMHHRLGLYSRYPTRDRFTFLSEGPPEELQLPAKLRTNSVHLLREYACGGHGIVCIPTFVAANDLLQGNLKVVLPRYVTPPFGLSAVYPASQRGQLKLKLFLEALALDPGQDPPWDKALLERRLILRSDGSAATGESHSV
ncbi:DNA-binding transcriptional regulator, LysR family [Paraburkholderia steynii]|uniref:DNA-binding transcriptional regulator, LysR family n=1 Tax=Paraburkholderia steynii TaxID=1245441 RepID=A0A7Z7FKP1_9BURK|nr:LysR family transcriptional regulator [Paraburkholderia steynii]SDI50622.1 DNA-binding transcriptional regulator, LysR family [Paraburkholderia steynii]